MVAKFNIILPTYNSGQFIEKCISSINNQTFDDWHLTVIDNFSTDKTVEIIKKKINPEKLKIFFINNNGIIAKSRNLGIKNSQSEWIALLDSDDFWHKDKLFLCNSIINNHVDIIYHDVEIINKVKKNKLVKIGKLKKPIIIDLLNKGNVIYNSSLIIRKNILLDVGLIDESKNMISSEDFNLLLKISNITDKFIYLPKNLCQYTLHDKNTSKQNFDWSISARNAYKKYLHCLDKKTVIKKKIEFLYLKSKYYLLNKKYNKSFKLWIICFLKGNFKIKCKSLLLIIIYFFKKMK